MKTVDRKELITTLESVSPGLATRNENVEQSSCFVFKDELVYTFNEEILCYAPCDVGVTGAIPAETLLSLLRKMDEEKVRIFAKKKTLVIKGNSRKAGIRFEAKTTLPVDSVEKPKNWNKLTDGLLSAVDMVKNCCSTNDIHFGASCVHFMPDYIEAFDNAQACRAKVQTGLKPKDDKSLLVRGHSAAYLADSGATKFSETKNWLHFRSPSGRVICCRKYLDKYPDLNKVFITKGAIPFKLPPGLSAATDRASVITSSDGDSTISSERVAVSIASNKLQIVGLGSAGWYRESKKLKYTGRPLKFAISPAVLRQVTKEHTKVSVIDRKLCIEGENWKLIFCLYDIASKGEK